MAQQSNALEFLSPVGRIVQGHPLEAQTHDQDGKPYVIKSGPKAGETTKRYFVALAFPKLINGQPNQEFNQLYAAIDQAARTGYPQFFNGAVDASGRPGCTHPRFSWKVIDGDGVDGDGKPNNSKPGFAGHWVVRFSSSFAPRCCYAGKYDPKDAITDVNFIKRGWYGRISGTIEANIGSQTPGVYVNLGMFELVGGGEEIATGPNMAEAFGRAAANTSHLAGQMTALPMAGPAAAAPPAPNGTLPPGYTPPAPLGGQPAGALPPGYTPPTTAATANPPPPAPNGGQPPPPPNTGFVQAAAAQLPQYTPLPPANGYSFESYIGNGWTVDALVQGGYFQKNY